MYRAIILTIIAFCLFAGSAFADVPRFINFQGNLLDSTGAPVTDGGYLLKFIIWNDPSATNSSNIKWNSNFQVIDVSGGLFEYQLGSTVPFPDGLFSKDTILYLGVTEGANPEMLPRTKLVSVGYAFHALRADTAKFAFSVANQSVTSLSIQDGTIQGTDLSPNIITTVEIVDNSITASDLAPGSVESMAIAAGAVQTSEIQDSTIINADIDNSANIAVTKISGTAVNLSSTQKITGEKQFGDSTMTVYFFGINIGDNGQPLNQLIRVGRNYNTTQRRWGYHSRLINQSSGIMTGISSQVNNNGTGYRAAYEGYAGSSTNTSGISYGCFVESRGSAGSSVYGIYAIGTGNSTNKYAGYFQGNVHVTGTLSKSSGSFKIDHPLDPANKYLVHSFVESPDMMNVYNGNVTLDGNGTANVTLPDYFDALNKDYRYQLTSIGSPGPNLYIASEISSNQFVISGGEPNSKVSWQVTGVRKDAYAEAHRIKVEPDKPIAEKGLYLHPVELGLSETKQLHYEMHKDQLLERERMASESTQEQ